MFYAIKKKKKKRERDGKKKRLKQEVYMSRF